jgi:hypothetical protein
MAAGGRREKRIQDRAWEAGAVEIFRKAIQWGNPHRVPHGELQDFGDLQS